MGKFTFNSATGGTFAAWVADPHSITLRGIGARIDFSDFGDQSVPSGTAVEVVTRAGLEFVVPSAGTAEAFLLLADAINGPLTGSSDTVSLVTGGSVYENKLPSLTAEQKTALGARFAFQNATF